MLAGPPPLGLVATGGTNTTTVPVHMSVAPPLPPPVPVPVPVPVVATGGPGTGGSGVDTASDVSVSPPDSPKPTSGRGSGSSTKRDKGKKRKKGSSSSSSSRSGRSKSSSSSSKSSSSSSSSRGGKKSERVPVVSDTPAAFAAAAAAATAAAITVGAQATQQALQQQQQRQVPNTGSYLGIPSYHTTANDDVSAITSASSVSSKNSLTEAVQLATAAQVQAQAQAQAQCILGALGAASVPIAPSQQPQHPAPGVYDALLANMAAAQQRHSGVTSGAQKRRSPAGNPQLVPLGMPAPGPDGTVVQPNKRRKAATVPPGGPQPPSAIPTATALDLASLSAAASISTNTITGSVPEQQPAGAVVPTTTGLMPTQHTTLPTAVTPAAPAPMGMAMGMPITLPPPTTTTTAPTPAAPVSAAASVATSASGTTSPPVVAELDPHQKAEIAKNMLYKAYMAALTASEE